MLFQNWEGIVRTIVVGVLAYVTLILFLRISGKRTLAKLNAFDLVVTVALGSTFATILLNRNVSLAEGALAFALLIGLQYVVTWSSVRVAWVRRTVTGEPAPRIHVRRDLWARIARSVFYEMVEMAQEVDGRLVVRSGGQIFSLGAVT